MSTAAAISLERTHEILGWPEASSITNPKGSGASVYASLVRDKIGRALSRMCEDQDIRVGVLMADPSAPTSDPPLAIVVEFEEAPGSDEMRELQRLCWNFSHVPTLITLEPAVLRVWSCCEAPDTTKKLDKYLVRQLRSGELSGRGTDALKLQAARALHWINLVSGTFFSDHKERFNRNGRADQTLLGNLRHIRSELAKQGLTDDDVCHDLLARIIFVQFLFDRKDQDGNPALTAGRLHRLQRGGTLSRIHDSFHSLLDDYEDTYRLFDWLNAKFNGDLFPGEGETSKERAIGWAKEREVVRPEHLALLANFIRGDVDMPSGQISLWPQYAFDVIPLEFISSIYETFVTERAASGGIFYTPPHLVDFVLDEVLPWDGHEWDLKIIDPACGSGIFLVKSFQRLVHRWKLANPETPIRAEILRRLLERNIFGVDIDPHAVRVACFSLYLAMCDEIEPRHYWTQVMFPTMRERRLICADFFCEEKTGFQSTSNSEGYDLVVGNAPWGDSIVTDVAKEWAASPAHSWTVANKDIGGIFLGKAALLSKRTGTVALIQSANSLLFNISSKAKSFRSELFSRHRVRKIYNLSALRFRVFRRKTHTTTTSVSPCCIVILKPETPLDDEVVSYISPKHTVPFLDEFTIVIEPTDRKHLTVSEAIEDPAIWAKLMWGTKRDVQLANKLSAHPTLGELEGLASRQGVKFGDRKKVIPAYKDRHIFNSTMFPEYEDFPFLDADHLPVFGEQKVDSRASTDTTAFAWPQLLLKQSWHKPSWRFQARLTRSDRQEAVLCNESYYSLHSKRPEKLEAACAIFNSTLAVYLLLLKSGRFAFIPKPSKSELLGLPIPENARLELSQLSDTTASDLDSLVFSFFALKDAERVLVEDMIRYTLSDFLDGTKSVGWQPTGSAKSEEHLHEYCNYFVRVLKAGFGSEKPVEATIFKTQSEAMPYRLVAYTLGEESGESVRTKELEATELLSQFERLNLMSKGTYGGIYNQRFVRIYDASSGVPTVFVIKPDQKRFWTRTMALQDADEVAVDLFTWRHGSKPVLEAVE